MIGHIRDAIPKAMKWANWITRAEFGHELTPSSMIRPCEMAGEAAGRLSKEFRESHPELEVRRLRD